MKRGFTLLELLIVTVILGILATIVVPQFTDATQETRSTSTRVVLRTLRFQLERYKFEHQDRYPQLSELWVNLIEQSDPDGTLNPAGKYGGYLVKPPYNPFTKSFTVVAPGAESTLDGWTYDETNGKLAAVGFDEMTGVYTAP